MVWGSLDSITSKILEAPLWNGAHVVMKIYRESEEIIRRWQWGDPAMRNLTDLILRIGGEGPGKAVDVGCGSGRVATGLARSGFDVTGVDSEEKVVELARRIAAEMGVRVDYRLVDFEGSTGDLEPASYDLAVCCEVLDDRLQGVDVRQGHAIERVVVRRDDGHPITSFLVQKRLIGHVHPLVLEPDPPTSGSGALRDGAETRAAHHSQQRSP